MAMDVETLNININVDLSGMERGLRRADNSVRNFTNNMGQNLRNVGNKMKNIGTNMTTFLTLPIAGLGGVAVKTAADFESSMNRVQALSGATATQFIKLEDQAKELGRTTQFSATQAGEAMGFLAMAGFDAEQILGAMPSTLQLAASAQIDLGRAADITSNIMSGYGLTVDELTGLNDILVKSFTNANVDLTMLGESFKYVGPIAKQQGIKIEELSAAIGILGSSGIQGTQAGTSLRQMMLRLAAPPKPAEMALKRLGLSVFDNSGKMKSLSQIMGELRGTHNKLGSSTQEVTQDMKDLFGMIGITGAQILYENSTQLSEFTTELENSGGTAKRIADVQMKGLNGALKEIRSALEGVAIAIAEAGLLEKLTMIAKKITPIIQRLAEANPKFLNMSVIIAGLIAFIGPLIAIIGGFAVAISAISTPVLAVIGGLSALIATLAIVGTQTNILSVIITKIKELFNAVKPKLIDLKTQFESTFGAMFDTIKQVVSDILPVFQSETGSTIDMIVGYWSSLIDVVIVLLKWIEKLYELFQVVWPAIRDIVINVLKIIIVNIQTAITIITEIFKAFKSILSGDWSALWESIKTIFTTATKGIITIFLIWFNYIVEIFKKLGIKLKEIWNITWDWIKEKTTSFIDWIKNSIKNGFDFVKNLIKKTIDNIVNAFKWLYEHNYYFQWLVDFVVKKFNFWKLFISTVLKKIKDIFLKVVTGIYNFVKMKFTQIKNVITQLLTPVIKVVSDIFNKIASSIKNKSSKANSHVKELFNKIKTTITNVTGKAYEWGKNLISNLIKGMKSMARKAKNAATDVMKGIARILGFHSPAEEGPGKDADEWSPNLMKMYTKGIKDFQPKLKLASLDAIKPVSNALNDPNEKTQSISNINNLSMEGMFKGAIFNVRKDEDIKAIARELYNLQKSRNRALGVT